MNFEDLKNANIEGSDVAAVGTAADPANVWLAVAGIAPASSHSYLGSPQFPGVMPPNQGKGIE